MNPDIPPLRALPDPVQQTLRDFEKALSIVFRLRQGEDSKLVYESSLKHHPEVSSSEELGEGVVRTLSPREGPVLELELLGCPFGREDSLADLVIRLVARSFEFSQEVRFFTYELSERYEEINLLYSISETLGSLLSLNQAARVILGEVRDVLGAKRGSLWVYEAETDLLNLAFELHLDQSR